MGQPVDLAIDRFCSVVPQACPSEHNQINALKKLLKPVRLLGCKLCHWLYAYVGIVSRQAIDGRSHFLPTDIGRFVQNLSIQIRNLDIITVDDS